MKKILIHTAQNIDIEYQIAHLGERILAAIMDYIIIFSYIFTLIFIFVQYVKSLDFVNNVIFFTILGMPMFFYDLLCEVFLEGQSFGKKFYHLRVVKLDGTRPSLGAYLLRWIFRLIDFSLFSAAVAIITILINGKGQRIGDIAAGTTVIRLKQETRFSDTIFEKIDRNYNPVFPASKELSDSVITTAKEALNFYDRNRNAPAGQNVLLNAKAMIEKRVNIASHLPPDEFLQTIIKDYTYYNSDVSQ